MSSLRTNPYVGLRPFFADDSLYFFGREQQTAELLEILHQHRFLGVVGSSGSGKSSLVRAGLLPSLLAGFLVEDRDHWHTVQIKPGDAPLGNLASGFVAAMSETINPEEVEKLEQDIRENHTEGVIEFLQSRLKNNDNLFLLVDQFEEIFAFRGTSEDDESQLKLSPPRLRERARRKAEADDFVDLLIALSAQRDLPIYVTLTMRTDFLGDCDLFYGLPEALNQGRYLVPRMTRRQMRDAIECPAILKHAKMAPRLLDYVLNEVGDRFDRLPVLQHALLRTWDAWLESGGIGTIEIRHFDAAGGLEHALDQDAENALKGIDLEVTARIFKRLTDTDNSQRRVRSPARISELTAASGAEQDAVEEIITRFKAGGRSFVHGSPDGKPDDPRVDISHESLIRQWDRLRGWVDEEHQSRDRYIDLVERARERKQHGLLWPPGLDAFMDWKEEVNPLPGWAKRYSVADDDFVCAMDYLDESVKVRCEYLAENEIRSDWQKVWHRPLIAIEVVVGVYLARKFDLLDSASEELGHATEEIKELAEQNELAAEGAKQKGSGSFLEFWEGSKELLGTIVSLEFLYVSLFLMVCIGLNRLAKSVHHRIVLPKILQKLVASKGRIPSDLKTKADELPDAIVVQHTTYASSIGRIGGYAVDNMIFMLVVFLSGIAFFFFFEDLIGELIFSSFGATIIAYPLFLLVFAWLYETLQVASKRQATLGMRAIGIFRTDLHGERVSFARATAWWLLRLISYITYGLGFAVQPFTKKRQTFHDWAARTVVLQRPEEPASGPKKPRSKIKTLLKRVFVILAIGAHVLAIISMTLA